MNREIRIFPDAAAAARATADEIAQSVMQSVAARNRFSIALSGGSTPEPLYEMLAQEPYRSALPWDKIHFFWGDERHVPPDHPESNFRMAHQALLSRIPIADANIHRIPAEEPDARRAAEMYEREIRDFFDFETGYQPRFDFILLGIGPDGHTASLFPETEALREQQRAVTANWVPKLNAWRITLTLPALNHAATVLFLTGGAEKAAILRTVLHGPLQPELYPAQAVQPENGRLLWFLDRAGAA